MNLTGARQHLPALLLRSLGRALATAGGHGRHDHREVRRDIVVGFEHERDARRFWDAMRKRLEEFSLSLHPDQTRPIEFGRHAVARRAQRGLRKPERSRSWASVCCRGAQKGGQQELRRAVQAAVKDEGGPLGIGFQERVPNHSKRLWSRAVVVSVGAKARGMTPEQVCVRETSESKPTEDASLRSTASSKPGACSLLWDKPVGCLMTGRAATGVEGA